MNCIKRIPRVKDDGAEHCVVSAPKKQTII